MRARHRSAMAALIERDHDVIIADIDEGASQARRVLADGLGETVAVNDIGHWQVPRLTGPPGAQHP